jgi:hypothetical protein
MVEKVCTIKISELKYLQDRLNSIRNDLSITENSITDLYAPLPKPKKGWAMFKTSRGYVSFKLREKKSKKGFGE